MVLGICSRPWNEGIHGISPQRVLAVHRPHKHGLLRLHPGILCDPWLWPVWPRLGLVGGGGPGGC
eukprot:6140820-Pyramimonas_sp.AAC.1